MQDRVPQARIYMVWNTPQWGSVEATLLDITSDVLSGGKSSRLYKRLVYDDQIATDVFAFQNPSEIGSNFVIQATVKPGGSLAAVEKAINEELARFIKEGPTADELARVKTQYFAAFTRGIERIGGFGGKSDILATNMVYGGDPAFYKTRLAQEAAATADEVRKATADWLSDGVYILEVQPYPQLAASASRRRPRAAPRSRQAAHRDAPGHRARDARERPQSDRGAPRRCPGGQPRPARRRRLGCRRRQPWDGRAGDEHARRGHRDARRARDLATSSNGSVRRSTRVPGSTPAPSRCPPSSRRSTRRWRCSATW